MKTLFDKITLLFEDGTVQNDAYLLVEDKVITYIGKEMPEGKFDRIINGEHKLLCPGFYNGHTHVPMTLFRGYAENLPLSRWLHEKIFPAEDRLYPEAVHAAAMLSAAEMIQGGTVSFSDMYFFCDEIVDATEQAGLKANISRSAVAFDPSIKAEEDSRFLESIELFKKYHNYADGRIKIDMSIHAEYSTVASSCRYISDFALENGIGIQLHLSETKAEHEECLARHGVTPTQFFAQNGVFRVPVTAAHCVHLSDDDIRIMVQNGATAVHNPSSNLKLGSGVMRLSEMAKSGMNITLGTDGAASNNTIDIMKEAYLAAILQKGITGKTDEFSSAFFVSMMTENGAKMQGRADSGKLKVGYRADVVMLDMDMIHTLPIYSPCDSFLYSSNSSNVMMTMVDGQILYENGEFKTLDVEKIKADFKNITEKYFLD